MIEHPKVLVVADPDDQDALVDLFARRGFDASVTELADEVLAYLAGQRRDAAIAVIVDLGVASGCRALSDLAGARRRPVVVALVDDELEVAAIAHLTDATFAKPIDRGLLFARIVTLLAARRNVAGPRRPGRQARITGVIGAVQGNALFHRLIEEVETIILPVNASAILERVAEELGVSPFQIKLEDVVAMTTSGRLAEALVGFADVDQVDVVIERIMASVARA